MKVKIGDKLYSDEDIPIMLILDDNDKGYISNMGKQTKYCRFPYGMSPNKMRSFMGLEPIPSKDVMIKISP